MRQSVIVLFALGLNFGCGVRAWNVQQRHAGEFGCPPEQVKVTQLAMSSYRAEGCGKSAVYECIGDGACPRNSQVTDIGTSAGASVTAGGHSSGPMRERLVAEGPEIDVIGEITPVTTDLFLEFVSPLVHREAGRAPKRDENGKVVFEKGSPVMVDYTETKAQPKWSGCTDVRAIVGGEPAALGAPAYTADSAAEHLRVQVSIETLERIRDSDRTVGVVCSERWGLLAGAKGTLNQFLLRVREETALQQPAKPAATPSTAPSTNQAAGSTQL